MNFIVGAIKISNEIDKIQIDIDNYIQTVGAILAFSNILSYNNKYKSIIGKKLKTSTENKISPDTYVTPDIVSKNSELGIVTEVKKSVPNDISYWYKIMDQLKKYDDKLSGWINENDVIDHDIVLLTTQERSYRLLKYIDDEIKRDNFIINRSISVIEFSRIYGFQICYNIKKVYGTISDNSLDGKLDECIPVPLNFLTNDISRIKFYDSEPHVVYTMSIIWNEYISKKPTDEERRECAKNNKTISIDVNLDDVHNEIKAKTGPIQEECLQCEIPKKKWIKKALDKYVEIGYGEKIDNNNYSIKFRHHPNMKDIIEHFAKKILNASVIDESLDNYLE